MRRALLRLPLTLLGAGLAAAVFCLAFVFVLPADDLAKQEPLRSAVLLFMNLAGPYAAAFGLLIWPVAVGACRDGDVLATTACGLLAALGWILSTLPLVWVHPRFLLMTILGTPVAVVVFLAVRGAVAVPPRTRAVSDTWRTHSSRP